MKKCPFCAEEIQDNAIVCKHCGKDLDKKKVNNKQYRWSPLKVGCGIFFTLIVLIAVISINSKPASVDTANNAVKQIEVKKLVDVPNLLGKSFTEIKDILGEPTNLFQPTAQQKQMGVTYTVTWDISDINVEFDYSTAQDKIGYIFLGNNGVKYSANQLMTKGGLSATSNDYTVKPVNSMKSDGITGLHVCQKGYKGEFCR